MNDLVTAEDIANRLGLVVKNDRGGSTIRTWRRRYDDFPTPIKESDRAVIWSWPDVEEWARATGRLNDVGEPVRPTTDPTRRKKARGE